MVTPDPTNEVPGFALAQFVYNVQVQQIDRSAVNAQGLLTALAVLVAFSGPLVVSEPAAGRAGVVIGAVLLVLFTCIATAAFWTLRVVYVGRRATGHVLDRCGAGGFLYFGDISQFSSPVSFGDYASALSDPEQIAHLYSQAWQLANIAQVKSRATVLAVKWTLAALITFLFVLIVRYVEVNL